MPKGIFVGYGEQEGVKGCRVYGCIQRKYFISQHVTLNEEVVLPLTKLVIENEDSFNENDRTNTFIPYVNSKHIYTICRF